MLLHELVDYARTHHAPGLEGYPVEGAGFHRVAQTSSHSASRVRWLMRHDLD